MGLGWAIILGGIGFVVAGPPGGIALTQASAMVGGGSALFGFIFCDGEIGGGGGGGGGFFRSQSSQKQDDPPDLSNIGKFRSRLSDDFEVDG
jgi:hypothetical protein